MQSHALNGSNLINDSNCLINYCHTKLFAISMFEIVSLPDHHQEYKDDFHNRILERVYSLQEIISKKPSTIVLEFVCRCTTRSDVRWIITRANMIPLVWFTDITHLLNSIGNEHMKSSSVVSNITKKHTTVTPKPLCHVSVF